MRKFSLLLLLVFCSCSVIHKTDSPGQLVTDVKHSPKSPMDPGLEKTSSALHHYLIGQLQYNNEDFPAALRNFEKASELVENPAPILHTKLAELFVRSGELDKALKESEKALSQTPGDPHAMLLHAGILEAMQRGQEAEPIYRKLIRARPHMIDAYILLSTYYLNTQEFGKSIEILNSLVSKNPGEAVAYTYLGRVYEVKGDLNEAESKMRKAAGMEPESSQFQIELLRILIKQKKIEQAKTVCNQVLARDPNNLIVRKILGQLLIGENKFDEALTQFQFLETIEQDATDTRFKIALIQIGRRNFKEAITELNLVLAAKGDYPEARYYLASVYAAIGRKKEAVEELLKIGEEDGTYVQSRTLAALILKQEGDYGNAEKAVRKAIEAKPEDKSLFSYLIMILRDGGKLSEARDLTERAVKEEPDNEKLLFNYAGILNDLGEQDKASAVMEKILVINPKNADALNFVAYNLAEKGTELVRAEELITQALAIRPNDGYFLDTLGWVYYRSGNYEKAVVVLERAANLVSDDIEILEHFADALSGVSNTVRAAEVYRAALALKPDEKDRDEIKARERIRKKLEALGPQ